MLKYKKEDLEKKGLELLEKKGLEFIGRKD